MMDAPKQTATDPIQTATVREIADQASRYKGVRVLMVEEDQALVSHYGTAFLVNDNGGEINVIQLNSGKLPESIPLTWFDEALSAETMAYRVHQMLKGQGIDWHHRGL